MNDFTGVSLKINDYVVFARKYGTSAKFATGTIKGFVYADDGTTYVVVNDGVINCKFVSTDLIKIR